MKKLIALLFTFKIVSMEQSIASDEYKKKSGSDSKIFELHWGPFGWGDGKSGWPHFYIDEKNRKENLAAIVDHRIENELPLDYPIIALDKLGSPLYEACSSDDLLDITLKLLDHGADPNMIAYSDHQRPIHHAVRCFAIETIKALIKAGAKVNAKMKDGRRPLHLISRNGYFSFRRDKQIQIMQLLLANGARPNARDELGQTPLFGLSYVETSKNDWPLIATLLDSGARISVKDVGFDSVKRRLKILNPEVLQLVKKKRKEVRLLKLLQNSGKKDTSYFTLLPREIIKMVIEFV